MTRPHKNTMFLRIAKEVALQSTCSRLQVGCVITDDRLMRIVSIGYNGNARGLPNGCERDEPGNCGCIHAEDNALLKAPYGEPLTMFITIAPCRVCSKRIINSSVKTVVYADEYRHTDGLILLRRADITILQWEM